MAHSADSPSDGLIIASYGRTLLVEDADGECHQCVARKSAGKIFCGDRVRWQMQAQGPGIVTEVCSRTSLLSRSDDRGESRPVCANVDQFIVVSAVPRDADRGDHPLSSSRDLIDCYLAAAELLGVETVIAINKIDLLQGSAPARLEAGLAPYRAAGYRVAHTSTRTGAGIAALRDQLKGRRSVFVGESGVGKSSLIKTLIPEREVRIGALTAAGGKGRHTTTVTMLFHLPEGGDIIDSPGVREFGLWNVAPGELAAGFREFRGLLGACRYRDCRHIEEPGCALSAAADSGAISRIRLESYRRILQSIVDSAGSGP